jgi:hypothetical protein
MKLLTEKKLDNGMQLSFINGSRLVAGDRWLVVLKLLLTMPLAEEMLSEIARGEERSYLLEQFEGHLSFELERKKHFVDEKDVDSTLDDLIALAEANMVDYFGRQDYVQRLFNKKLQQYRERYALEQHLQQNDRVSSDVVEPDDFSACFK